MLDYRLYFLDEAGHIQGVVEFDSADDDEAIAHAQTYADGRAMELWRRDRWIRRFNGDEPPPRTTALEIPR
jgi:hypothetical protein